jgi:hypothetical protein
LVKIFPPKIINRLVWGKKAQCGMLKWDEVLLLYKPVSAAPSR